MPPRVIHLLRWLDPDTLEQRGEEPLRRMPAAALRELLARPLEDALLGSYPVGPQEASGLAPWLAHAIDRDRYVYFIEPAQDDAAENPVVVAEGDR